MNTPLLQTWQARWRERPARERRLVLLALWLLGTALVVSSSVAPALQTWRDAAQHQAELDRQSQQMLQLQAQARQLQATARLPRTEAIGLLESSAQTLLGPQARVQVQGEQLRVTLQAATPGGLSQWLVQARERAQALPQSARLQRLAPTPTTASGPPDVLWSGELTLRLP